MRHYDIIISYRRDGGHETAQMIAEHLKNKGYKVFLDVENLREGPFNTQLLEVIKQCKDFILVIPKDGLDRCNNEDDWVRLELECAIENNKNVIPVLLRGFVFPEKLPESIKEVKYYNGVAAGDNNYTDAQLQKLRSFLKSKNGFSFALYKKWIYLAIIFIVAIGGIVSAVLWHNYKEYVMLCKGVSDKMAACLVETQGTIISYEDAADYWYDYTDRLDKITNIKDTAYLYGELEKIIYFKQQQEHRYQIISLSENDKKQLRKHRIQPEDIEVFFVPGVSAFFENVNIKYSFLLSRSAPNFYYHNKKYARERTDDDLYCLQLEADAVYYYFLYVLSQMPKEVQENFDKIKSTLTKFPDVPTDNKKEYYEALYVKVTNKLEEKVLKDIKDLEVKKLALQEVEDTYNALQEIKQMQEMLNNDTEIKQKTQEVAVRQEEVEVLQTKLQDEKQKSDAKYEIAMEKFVIVGDDQWLDWARVVRMSSISQNAMQSRADLAKELNISIKKVEEGYKYDYKKMFETVDRRFK